MIIEDGTGNGNNAKVDSENNLHVYASSEPVAGYVSRRNKSAFVVASDFITVSNTSIFSGLLYIKYTGSKILHIDRVRVCSNAGAYVQSKIIKNPTAGTLISGAIPAKLTNMNFSSSNVFSGLCYVGSSGSTVTDGDLFSNFTNKSPGHSVQEYSSAFILNQNSCIALVCKPDATMDICVEIQIYEDQEDI